MSATKTGQTISGYKLQNQLATGENLEDLVLSSPDGSLYYQQEAKDLVQDPNNICDLWQTADKKTTVRIRRSDGTVDAVTEVE